MSRRVPHPEVRGGGGANSNKMTEKIKSFRTYNDHRRASILYIIYYYYRRRRYIYYYYYYIMHNRGVSARMIYTYNILLWSVVAKWPLYCCVVPIQYNMIMLCSTLRVQLEHDDGSVVRIYVCCQDPRP